MMAEAAREMNAPTEEYLEDANAVENYVGHGMGSGPKHVANVANSPQTQPPSKAASIMQVCLFGFGLIVAIAMIVEGVRAMHKCPAEPMVPHFLIGMQILQIQAVSDSEP